MSPCAGASQPISHVDGRAKNVSEQMITFFVRRAPETVGPDCTMSFLPMSCRIDTEGHRCLGAEFQMENDELLPSFLKAKRYSDFSDTWPAKVIRFCRKVFY